MLCMPVLDRNKSVIAVAQMINKFNGTFTAEDEVMLQAFTQHAAVALMNSSLYSEVKHVKTVSDGLLSAVPAYCVSINGVGKVTGVSAPGAGGEAGTGAGHSPLPPLTEVRLRCRDQI
jgi:adenylate cyclase